MVPPSGRGGCLTAGTIRSPRWLLVGLDGKLWEAAKSGSMVAKVRGRGEGGKDSRSFV